MGDDVRQGGKGALGVLLEALAWAHNAGIIVALGPLGVRPKTRWKVFIGWEKDPGTGLGVNPLGAAILLRQPKSHDPDIAKCMAIGMGLPWCEGLSDGMSADQLSTEWMRINMKSGDLYQEGFRVGRELLARCHVVLYPPVGEGKDDGNDEEG